MSPTARPSSRLVVPFSLFHAVGRHDPLFTDHDPSMTPLCIDPPSTSGVRGRARGVRHHHES
jgi:hypothetical protein